jgi:hypothetical protein
VGYSMGMLAVDYGGFEVATNNLMYTIWGAVHFVNAWMYLWSWYAACIMLLTTTMSHHHHHHHHHHHQTRHDCLIVMVLILIITAHQSLSTPKFPATESITLFTLFLHCLQGRQGLVRPAGAAGVPERDRRDPLRHLGLPLPPREHRDLRQQVVLLCEFPEEILRLCALMNKYSFYVSTGPEPLTVCLCLFKAQYLHAAGLCQGSVRLAAM